MVTGAIQQHQHPVIASLQEENRILKVQHGPPRLRLTDTERRPLAALTYPLVARVSKPERRMPLLIPSYGGSTKTLWEDRVLMCGCCREARGRLVCLT
jgi:hypothetical protein